MKSVSYTHLSPDGEGVVTDMKEARDHSTGEAGAVIGYTYEVAIPSRRFEKIRLTVNGAALIEPDFFKKSPTAHVKITDVKGFIGKWYRLKGETEMCIRDSNKGVQCIGSFIIF